MHEISFFIIGILLWIIVMMLIRYKKKFDYMADVLKGMKSIVNFIWATTELTDWAVRRLIHAEGVHTNFDEEAGEITIKVRFDERNKTRWEISENADKTESDIV